MSTEIKNVIIASTDSITSARTIREALRKIEEEIEQKTCKILHDIEQKFNVNSYIVIGSYREPPFMREISITMKDQSAQLIAFVDKDEFTWQVYVNPEFCLVRADIKGWSDSICAEAAKFNVSDDAEIITNKLTVWISEFIEKTNSIV